MWWYLSEISTSRLIFPSLHFFFLQLFSVPFAGSCSGVEDQTDLLGLQATRGMSQNRRDIKRFSLQEYKHKSDLCVKFLEISKLANICWFIVLSDISVYGITLYCGKSVLRFALFGFSFLWNVITHALDMRIKPCQPLETALQNPLLTNMPIFLIRGPHEPISSDKSYLMQFRANWTISAADVCASRREMPYFH